MALVFLENAKQPGGDLFFFQCKGLVFGNAVSVGNGKVHVIMVDFPGHGAGCVCMVHHVPR